MFHFFSQAISRSWCGSNQDYTGTYGMAVWQVVFLLAVRKYHPSCFILAILLKEFYQWRKKSSIILQRIYPFGILSLQITSSDVALKVWAEREQKLWFSVGFHEKLQDFKFHGSAGLSIDSRWTVSVALSVLRKRQASTLKQIYCAREREGGHDRFILSLTKILGNIQIRQRDDAAACHVSLHIFYVWIVVVKKERKITENLTKKIIFPSNRMIRSLQKR